MPAPISTLTKIGEGRWTDAEVLRDALERAHGSPKRAGELLGITRSVVWYHLRKHGMGGLPAEIRRQRRWAFDFGAA